MQVVVFTCDSPDICFRLFGAQQSFDGLHGGRGIGKLAFYWKSFIRHCFTIQYCSPAQPIFGMCVAHC